LFYFVDLIELLLFGLKLGNTLELFNDLIVEVYLLEVGLDGAVELAGLC